MLILLAFIFGAVYGAVLHFTMRGRASRGVAVAPALGALVAGAVYSVLTWAGLADTPWIWLAALAVPVVVVPLVLGVLATRRTAHDARERTRLRLA